MLCNKNQYFISKKYMMIPNSSNQFFEKNLQGYKLTFIQPDKHFHINGFITRWQGPLLGY